MGTDEFEITATHPHMEARVWTRSEYGVAKIIADSAITKLGYGKAVVVNTFGGDRSDVLYEVEALIGSHSSLITIEVRDHVFEHSSNPEGLAEESNASNRSLPVVG
jgi:hypothetical protein